MSEIFILPKPKIFHVIPWSSEKNIGVSYNNTMRMVGSNDWVCFLDGDAVHTTTYFGSRIEETVDKNPEYSLFTCHTNRVNCPYQIAPGVNRKTNDQQYHRNFGEQLWNDNKTSVMDVTKLQDLSGVLILINKKTWEEVGGFKQTKMLAVDNDIHRKVRNFGGKVGLMKGIYVQHWYRNDNANERSHLL